MSDTVNVGPLSPTEASLIPPERAFQIDPNGLGGLAQSVNLFQGAATVPLTVTTLKSRGELKADITLVYSSNLGTTATTWNLEAPTGPVGLGWYFGYDMITRDPTLSAQPTDGVCYLVAAGASNRLYRTTITEEYEEYEAESYQFWSIRYYPAKECWVVIREDGTQYTYGGLDGEPATSPVQYGIKWPGPDGLWTDSTVRTSGQALYPLAWNLASIASPWGDQILLEYENTLTQIGAAAGLSCTTSSRLRRVHAPTVQTMELTYAPKVYTAQIHEYQPAHVDPTNPDLHAYQDRSENLYLASITLKVADDASASAGQLVQTILFDYELVSLTQVTAPQDPADFYKRCLTGIRFLTPQGLPQSSMLFTYATDPTDPKAMVNPGALTNILYPQGGNVELYYATASLTGASRTLEIQPRATSKVWFGPSYTVILTYNGPTPGLSVSVFMWNGLWVSTVTNYDIDGIDTTSLNVSVQQEMFAISFKTTGSNPTLQVVLAHMRKGNYGQWSIDASPRTLPIQNGTQGTVVTGTDFAIAVTSGGNILAQVWDNRANTWSDQSQQFQLGAFDAFALAADANYFALASYTAGRKQAYLQLWYRVADTVTFGAATIDQPTINAIEWGKSTPDNFWSTSSSFAITTYVTGETSTQIDYLVSILQWDERFHVTTLVNSYSVPSNSQLPYATSVVSGSVVGNAANLLRFNGVEWDTGNLIVTSSGSSPHFVYGGDAALAVGSGITSAAVYNPYIPQWTNPPVTPSTGTIKPTINGDYLTIDVQVYYRDPTGTLNPIARLDPNMVPDSLVNSAPHFLAYENGQGDTMVVPLSNGQAGTPVTLPNQRIYVANGGTGTSLVGPSSLCTYTGSFDAPAALTLYQFVNQAITGDLTVPVVVGLSIDDGYNENWGGVWPGVSNTTRYYYDCDNVTLSPDGTVSAFAAATTVYAVEADGSAPNYPPPEVTPYGQSEYRYYNDRTAYQSNLHPVPDGGLVDEYPSLLNGLLYDKTDYDATGNPVERLSNTYMVGVQIADIFDASKMTSLVGAYVRQSGSQSAVYEAPAVLEGSASTLSSMNSANGAATAVPDRLKQLLGARGFTFGKQPIVARHRRGQEHLLRIYPDAKERHYYPTRIVGQNLEVSDAITRVVSTTYSIQTGLPISETADNVNSEGNAEILTRGAYYAWQVPAYSDMAVRHIWSPVCVSLRLWSSAQAPTETLPQAIQLVTYQAWPAADGGTGWAPMTTYVASSATAYDGTRTVPVNFSDWTRSTPPSADLWRLTGRTTARSTAGAAIESLDAANLPTMSVLDAQANSRVAVFTNASLGEAVFGGFEAYEDLSLWRLNAAPLPAAAIVPGDAHTGMYSVKVAPGAGALSTNLSLTPGRVYVASFWVKTNDGFDGDSGTCTVSLKVGNDVIGSFPIQGSPGSWAYRHVWVTAPGSGTIPLAAVLAFQNNKSSASSTLLLDDIMFAPLEGAATATVQDPVFWQTLAEVSLNGGISRTFYDSRQRSCAVVRPGGQVVEGAEYYLVRQSNISPDFVFPSAAPNMLTSIKAPSGGVFADLVNGADWTNQWAIANAAAWGVQNGVLVHTGSSEDTIAFQPTAGKSDYDVRLTVRLPQAASGEPIAPSKPLGLSIGSALRVDYVPGSGFRVTLDGSVQPTQAPDFGCDWHISVPIDPVTGQTSVQVFIDGRLIFATLATVAVAGAATITVSDTGIGFTSIACFFAPRLNLQFLDGAGKEVQRQAFTGSGVIIGGTIYDTIGRAAIGVKPAQIDRPLGYADDYVRSFDPTSGVMTGLASDAYPADDGFPYVRTEFEPTAQSLVSRQGSPGMDLALRYDSETYEELNPHTASYQYLANVQGEFAGDPWPTSNYFVTRIVNADEAVSYVIKTKLDQTVGNYAVPSVGAPPIMTQNFYDESGRLIKVLPPNGVTARNAGDPAYDRWSSTTTYDYLGQSIATYSPDAGETQYVFDNAGRVRFTMDAAGAAATPNQIVYTKYDALGRTAEEGLLQQAWDRAGLSAIALSDPTWPGQDAPHVVAQTWSYDGDGSDPTQFGRLIQTVTQDDLSAPVTQTFAYDLIGNTVSLTQVAASYDNTPRTIGYAYNALLEPVQTTFPSGTAQPSVTVDYDRLGRQWRVGTPADLGAFGTFTYDALNAVTSSMTPLSASTSLNSTRSYGPPGWLLQQTSHLDAQSPFFSETLTYTTGALGGAGYYDGKIASVTTVSAQGNDAYAYGYDFTSRLTGWRRQSDTSDAALSFDTNGNILTWSEQVSTRTYTYAPTSNQTTSVSDSSGASDAYTYSPDGGTASASRLGLSDITYAPTTGMTSRMTLTSTQQKVSFDYAAGSQRAVKRLLNQDGSEVSARLYLSDASGLPLYQAARADTTSEQSQFIYGPNGLTAVVFGGQTYQLVSDHLGSSRRLVDAQGQVVAWFDYGPFGITVKQGGDAAQVLLYRYTGQELDTEIGLYNYRARFYDPVLGRFFDVDPEGQGASPYAYVLNNPVNQTDPTGRFAWLAFLIVVAISAAIGAVAGAVTYAVSHQGNFDVGKFFEYALVGLVAGAAGGAAGYLGGVMATSALTAIGVSTSTSIASGVVVGAAAGAADGAVSGVVNQMGVNMIEQRPITEGLAQSAWMGAAIGAGVGGLMGGVTGYIHVKSVPDFDRPFMGVSHVSQPNAGIAGDSFADNVFAGKQALRFAPSEINDAGAITAARQAMGNHADDVVTIAAHGTSDQPRLFWRPNDAGGRLTEGYATVLRNETIAQNVNVSGIDLASCYGYSNGSARAIARTFQTPVRASTDIITATGNGRVYVQPRYALRGGAVRTYYPSQLRTSWNYLFGY